MPGHDVEKWKIIRKFAPVLYTKIEIKNNNNV